MYNGTNNHLECNILTINDNVNNANYSKFIDSISRRDRNEVYISIVKFQAVIPVFNSVDQLIAPDSNIPLSIIIEIGEARNVYYNSLSLLKLKNLNLILLSDHQLLILLWKLV